MPGVRWLRVTELECEERIKMPDIAMIGAALTSLKTATEIVKALRDVDVSLEKAEIKLKVIDLADALVEARTKVVEVQEVIQEKDKRIAELEHALELKAKLTRVEEAYYVINESGTPEGAPYCSHCWEIHHVGVHLHHNVKDDWHCPKCSNEFSRFYVGVLEGGEERAT